MRMAAEIIAVGTELLMGQICNTNAQFISKCLPEVGIYAYYHTVVGDNKNRLVECVNTALNRADIIITTGGLGPTQDDITRETIAEIVGKPLVQDQECLSLMENFFKNRGRVMTPNNTKQACFPKGSIIVKNPNGTAPGCIVEFKGKIVILLPGPPNEMKPMMEQSILPYLANKGGQKLHSVYMRIFGIGESSMEHSIMDLIDRQENPTIAPYASVGQVTLRITARYSDESELDGLINPVVNEIKNRLGDKIYSLENKELCEVVCDLLLKNKTTLAVAESCTGGMISAQLVEYPGVSTVFKGGFITYSNDLKSEVLNVSKSTLEKYGAVSENTAIEMAQGARLKAKSDIALAVTGIAGPGGGTENKPVGLVYIAMVTESKIYVKKLNSWGERARIRTDAMLHSFDMIRRLLLDLEI